MPIELKIIANNAFELAGELRQLGYVHKDDIAAMAAEPIAEGCMDEKPREVIPQEVIAEIKAQGVQEMWDENARATQAGIEAEEAAQPKKRRGRPPKVKAAEQPREVVPQEADDTPVPFAEPAVDEPPPTPADMAKSALVQLNSVGGRDAALEVLGRFGAKKFSEVPPERHDEFREICIIETQKRAS